MLRFLAQIASRCTGIMVALMLVYSAADGSLLPRVGLLLGIAPGHAMAAVPCGNPNGTYTNTFDGTPATAQGAGLNIVQATLNTGFAYLCVNYNSASGSMAWSMMDGKNTQGWTQIGIRYDHSTGSPHVFAQYKETSTSNPLDKELPGTVSGTHTYEETYDYNLGHINMLEDSTNIYTTNFDPAVSWSAPWNADYAGEVWDPGDDVPGQTSTHEHFTNLVVSNCRSCGLTSPTGLGLSSDETRFGYSWVTNNSAFDIWSNY